VLSTLLTFLVAYTVLHGVVFRVACRPSTIETEAILMAMESSPKRRVSLPTNIPRL
jgi:hypothetical protein